MSNTFDPDLQQTLGGLLGKRFMGMPMSKAEEAIEQAHATIAERHRRKAAGLRRHPRVTAVDGSVITVDFGGSRARPA